jgi:hypothetical protein
MIRSRFIAGIVLAAWNAGLPAAAQTNALKPPPPIIADGKAKVSQVEISEQLRVQCIADRRTICGKILRIFPNGILVESGYTNLLREPLTKSWLAPGSVVASLAPGLVESKEPGAMCVGTVFLTDLPRGKPRQYDYVMIAGYPTGEFSYESVGTIKRTVRRFSASLDKAVKSILAAADPPAAAPK